MTGLAGNRPRAPWHLWVLGVVSLIWFAGGANDYIQTRLVNPDYLEMAAGSVGVPVQVIVDYFGNYPLWANICWALGVWGAFAGSILLLLRSRFAFHALALSVIGLAGSTLYAFISDIPPELASTFQLVFTVVIWLSVLAMAGYVRAMTQRGVLR
jgi:hypothetical protein